MNPRYRLICQHCGYVHFTDGSDVSNLIEVKNAPLPKNANGKSTDAVPLPRKFKCSNCGYCFRAVKIPVDKKPEKGIELPPPVDIPDDDAYLKQWENESLKSNRKKSIPPPG